MMLKLYFTKAYDVVSWRFLFHTLSRMGMPEQFTQMVRMLFKDASVEVSINGEIIDSFEIRRRVW
jgi:hypothetical protein